MLQGETGDANAVMDASDLAEIKKLAGLPITESEAGIYTGQGSINTDPGPSQSPVGSNISWTASERNSLCREYNAKPGDQLWMLIMFSKPYLNGSLRDKIEAYLTKNPNKRYVPRPLPGDHE